MGKCWQRRSCIWCLKEDKVFLCCKEKEPLLEAGVGGNKDILNIQHEPRRVCAGVGVYVDENL